MRSNALLAKGTARVALPFGGDTTDDATAQQALSPGHAATQSTLWACLTCNKTFLAVTRRTEEKMKIPHDKVYSVDVHVEILDSERAIAHCTVYPYNVCAETPRVFLRLYMLDDSWQDKYGGSPPDNYQKLWVAVWKAWRKARIEKLYGEDL